MPLFDWRVHAITGTQEPKITIFWLKPWDMHRWVELFSLLIGFFFATLPKENGNLLIFYNRISFWFESLNLAKTWETTTIKRQSEIVYFPKYWKGKNVREMSGNFVLGFSKVCYTRLFMHEGCFHFLNALLWIICTCPFYIWCQIEAILKMKKFWKWRNFSSKVLTYFLPEASFGLRVLSSVASVCVCVCPCVCQSVCVCINHLLVRAITHHLFELGLRNLDKRCKRPWLRTLLFWGAIDLDLQGQIWLKSPNLPHFELFHPITHHLLKLESPNLDHRCKTRWLRSPLFWGLIDVDLHVNFDIFLPKLFALLCVMFSETILVNLSATFAVDW